MGNTESTLNTKMREEFIKSLRTIGIDDTVIWDTEKDYPIGELHTHYYDIFKYGWALCRLNIKTCNHHWMGKSENQYCKYCGIEG